MRRKLILLILCTQMAGCGHDYWARMKDYTEGAGFVNSLGFALNTVAVIGEKVTREDSVGPVDLDEEK